ncbi:MAG: co-chaperone GroES [Actinomycetota bacterium]
MKLQPLGDHIIVKTLESEEKTASGIVIPESAQEKPTQGKVIAVGSGRYEDGKRIPLEVKAGNKVIYSQYGGTNVKIDGEELLILSERDVLAIVK